MGQYRGLVQTHYKLWTETVTKTLAALADIHNLLRFLQEGIRRDKNANIQITNVFQAMEDAKHHNKNLYALYVDVLSTPKTTTNHGRLGIPHRMA